MSNPKIIGISGKNRSGKDTLAKLFIEDGYLGVSLGDIVRDEARKIYAEQDNPIARSNLTKTSNMLRRKRGSNFLFEMALNRFNQANKDNSYKGLVLYSVRAPIEADSILKAGGQLIWVESDDQLRYKRAMANLRSGEPEISFELFEQQEEEQLSPNPDLPIEIQMNINYVKSKATLVLENNVENIEDFIDRAAKLVKSIDI